ncbi:hypothetical protein LCGC14_0766960 [marine sediment metagenome]|uniref:Fibronectin type-III domain-containing protein n=1 Tax=marine sediment metagenome TaxID=412755 RepID=A0A0F9SJJ2_9ZZZZ
MTETYYTYAASQTGSSSVPSGTYALIGGENVTVVSQIGIRYAPTTGLYLLELTGDVGLFIAGNIFKRGGIWLSPVSVLGIVISEIGLSGVTGVGLESLDTAGRYGINVSDGGTVTPQKADTFFVPSSVTYDEGNGQGVYATMEGFEERQILLSSPANTATGILLQPLLQWSINGGSEDGDLLDIYIRKDDSNFTSADLIGSLVDATLNSSLQIVAGLEYNSTYYWQVQAANSAGGYPILLTSSIWSFTTTTFRPPAVPIGDGGAGDFTGENNMLTKKRFIAAANNKIWYENL